MLLALSISRWRFGLLWKGRLYYLCPLCSTTLTDYRIFHRLRNLFVCRGFIYLSVLSQSADPLRMSSTNQRASKASIFAPFEMDLQKQTTNKKIKKMISVPSTRKNNNPSCARYQVPLVDFVSSQALPNRVPLEFRCTTVACRKVILHTVW